MSAKHRMQATQTWPWVPGTRLPRTRGFARRLQRRLLSDLRLRARWEDPLVVPPAARPVLEAAVELVASAEDAFEYWPDPERDSRRTLAGRLAWRLHIRAAEEKARAERRVARARRFGEDAERQALASLRDCFAPPDEAEVERHLALLAHVGLLAPLDGGGLRLGIDCRPKPRTGAGKPKTSALKAATARANGSKNGEKRRAQAMQTEALMALQGGREVVEPAAKALPFGEPPAFAAVAAEGPSAPPNEGPTGGPTETPTEAVGGSSVGPGPRAPGLSSLPLAAAAASKKESINSYACTAAAAAKDSNPLEALQPRAGAQDLTGSQGGPTEGPKDTPTAGSPDDRTVQLLAFKIGTILQVDGRRGRAGSVLVATWLSLGLTGEEMLQVARNRTSGREAKIARGLIPPVGSFDFLDGAMRDEAKRKRLREQGEQAPLVSAALPTAAPQRIPKGLREPAVRSPAEVARAAEKRARRNALGETGRAEVQQGIDAFDKGDQAALQQLIARLHWGRRGYVIAVLVGERPEVGALYQRMQQEAAEHERTRQAAPAKT